ncbi:hypothetical protein IGL76_001905 [Enterococcus sp. DIV2381]
MKGTIMDSALFFEEMILFPYDHINNVQKNNP